MNQIYSKDNFVIIRADAEYIVINKSKQFAEGHTHIRHFKTAKYLIDMVIHGRIPYHLPIYLLVSLRRLSADDNYIQKLQRLITIKENRKQQYINR